MDTLAPLPHHDGHAILSGVAGSISLACWIIVFTPQLYENWRRKSAEGLSLAFVIIWLAGDVFNVLGAVLQKVLPTMLILAVYYTFADIVLLWQCIVYSRSKPLLVDEQQHHVSENEPLLGNGTSKMEESRRTIIKNSAIVLLVVLCGVLGYVLSSGPSDVPDVPQDPQPISISGQILGWICAVLYLASRVPQIRLNYQRKSTDGIAPLFFVFAALGNITYCVSIFAADLSIHALIINASWIVGAAGSLLLDFVIFGQFFLYR